MTLPPSAAPSPWPLAGLLLVAWWLRVLAYPMLDGSLADPLARRALGDAVRVLLFVGLPLVAVVRLEGRAWRAPFGLPHGSRPFLAWLVATAWLVAVAAVDLLVRPPQPLVPGGMRMLALLIVVASTFVTAAAEEFAFRGVLLPRMTQRHGAVAGQAATAALFVLVHWPGWIFLQGVEPAALALQSGQLFVFGLVLGAVTALAGSIWPAISLHAVNNLLVGLVFHRAPI
jgi:hypothetical protein